MSDVTIIEVPHPERWDFIFQEWRIDWSEEVELVDISIDVKVQLDLIEGFLEEIQARHVIGSILKDQVLTHDPAFG